MSVVTLTRRCEGCGAPLDGRRSDALTCTSACRKRVSRQRSTKCDNPQLQQSRNGGDDLDKDEPLERPRLTALERAYLRDQVARAQLSRRDPEQAATDRALFADDPGRVRA